MPLSLEEFCQQQYEVLYTAYYSELRNGYESKYGKRKSYKGITDDKEEEFKILARKQAIQKTILDTLDMYPGTEPADIWRVIYISHIYNRSGETDLAKINRIIQADQSWKKSSGHAFEALIKQIANPLLQEHSLIILLQKDLSELFKQKKITNENRDVTYLKSIISSNIFDLYSAFIEDEGNYRVFGCVQSKTSIRDRVTRDREPSIIAMQHFFYSIAIVLDGGFLKLPKFKNMVNGKSDEYAQNGWHAMYVFSNDASYNADRIFTFDRSMRLPVEHMIKAAHDWKDQRQWFNNDWRPTP